MNKKSVMKPSVLLPSVFDDFFRPWNEWFETSPSWPRMLNVPAVNITEEKDDFKVSLAVPGMKKEDFNIDIEGNMLTISSEKEQSKEEKETTKTWCFIFLAAFIIIISHYYFNRYYFSF